MAVEVTTKQHDTKITFFDIPTIDGVTVPPGDLAGCTLSFLLKTKDGSIALKKAAVINPDGSFSYDPVPADVATAAKFQQEWEVVYPGGKILTFPNQDW